MRVPYYSGDLEGDPNLENHESSLSRGTFIVAL